MSRLQNEQPLNTITLFPVRKITDIIYRIIFFTKQTDINAVS
ncbi:protein of unknown function [Maridesulfovibrio hydrothermalis AM13 = DSM 14728]|uniref:Uncharacterized protein n=1 Tax=Maridesulfovibrio hydrothermalis AM13 = DSM 14728 TaxID=1121451 RepID=L0R860_9BACT|nr:protein of unknown function [Maridesulfovibrio hydrothermalis AM13 = DSM 14728]